MEPRHGATYAQILALARATDDAGFDAFFAPTTSSGWTRTTRRTGRPTAGRRWPDWPGHQPDPARLARHRRHVPPTRPARHDRRERGRDERRGVELGLGTGAGTSASTRRSASRSRRRRAVRPAGRTVGDHHRAVGYRTRGGAAFSFAQALPRRGEPHRAPTGQRPHPPIIIGGTGPKRTPPSRPGSPTSSTAPSATTCARASRGSTRPASGSAATRPRSATRPCCRWSARPPRPR